MKVHELIKALSGCPQDSEVFANDGNLGLAEIVEVKTATNTYDELNDVIGAVFVMIR